jgi:hypothetical protein
LTDNDLLETKIKEFKARYEELKQPLTLRLRNINAMGREVKAKYDRLVDLYLESDKFGQQMLLQRKETMEEEIKRLMDQRNEAIKELDKLKARYYQEDWDFALSEFINWRKAEGLPLEDEWTFERRLDYIQRFDLRGEFTEDGLNLSCDLAKGFVYLTTTSHLPDIVTCQSPSANWPVMDKLPFLPHYSPN